MGSVATATCETSPLVMGGAGFSYQLHPDPESLPVVDILLRAFELGVRAIDTSPYYEPSEQLMGAALAQPAITSKYARSDFSIMTKVGRIKENEFDYSPGWVRKSVQRSLERFQTTYLDVVFCHDVEYVSVEEATTAVGVLLDFKRGGSIHKVGISGYDIDLLARIANLVRERYGAPVDVVQTWAQLTLQNTQAETRGFAQFRAAGINSVFCSSPLAVGLLRSGGIPVGLTGDWHPAPQALRKAAAEASDWLMGSPSRASYASIALQYAIGKARQNSTPDMSVATITGISTIIELEQNVDSAREILRPAVGAEPPAEYEGLEGYTELDEEAWKLNVPIFENIRAILGKWIDYDFSKQKVAGK